MVEKQDIRVERNVEYEKKQLKDINQLPLFMTAAVTTEFNADMASRCFCIKNDWKAPELKSNEVLVKMLWSSVNPVDYYLNTGKLHLVDAPFVNGRDGCGQIVQLGEEASRHFKMNDIVLGATTNWKYGTFGQYAVFKWDNLCLKPREISCEHAAALPVVLLTAWECFQKIDNPRNLKRILIHGGSGGVGSMAILLAKYYFNIDHVISTCRGSNCDYVKQLGADEVLNYNDVEFDQFLSQKYGKLDLVIDPVGGDVMLEKSYKLLDSKGYYITTVPLKNIDSNTSEIKEIIGFGIQFITNKLKSVFADAPQFFSVLCNYDGKTLDQLAKWMAQKNLHDKFRVTKYPFNEISTAMDQIHSGHTDGKLIIDMSM